MVPASSPCFSTRYRAVRKRWHEEWWSVVFGGPLAHLLLGALADKPWLTANRITLVGFACRLVGAPLLIVGRPATDLAAICLLQFSTVCDCLDGALARYRGTGSVLGAYLDKVTDAISILYVMTFAGLRAHGDGAPVMTLLVAVLGGASIVLRSYVFWVVVHLRHIAGAAPLVIDSRLDASQLTTAKRFRRYLMALPRIWYLSETDLYFWLCLGIVIGQLPRVIHGLGVGLAVWLVFLLIKRTHTVIQLAKPRTPTLASGAPP